MNKWKNLLIAISSNRIWFITFMCLDLFFIFLAWFIVVQLSRQKSKLFIMN